MLRELAAGRSEIEVPGATVREVVENLEQVVPGIAARLTDGGALRPNLAVAIDGEICTLGLLETVRPDSEIHFVHAISGG
jgi:hypothetical protein